MNDRHIIWSNHALDYEDWKDYLEEEYPELSENERISLMYEINGDRLDDERSNLNISLSQPILVIGDLGLWNGRRMAYNVISARGTIIRYSLKTGRRRKWQTLL